jgi:hypothetical protein
MAAAYVRSMITTIDSLKAAFIAAVEKDIGISAAQPGTGALTWHRTSLGLRFENQLALRRNHAALYWMDASVEAGIRLFGRLYAPTECPSALHAWAGYWARDHVHVQIFHLPRERMNITELEHMLADYPNAQRDGLYIPPKQMLAKAWRMRS